MGKWVVRDLRLPACWGFPCPSRCHRPHLHLGPAGLTEAEAPPRHCFPSVSHGSSLGTSGVRWEGCGLRDPFHLPKPSPFQQLLVLTQPLFGLAQT